MFFLCFIFDFFLMFSISPVSEKDGCCRRRQGCGGGPRISVTGRCQQRTGSPRCHLCVSFRSTPVPLPQPSAAPGSVCPLRCYASGACPMTWSPVFGRAVGSWAFSFPVAIPNPDLCILCHVEQRAPPHRVGNCIPVFHVWCNAGCQMELERQHTTLLSFRLGCRSC